MEDQQVTAQGDGEQGIQVVRGPAPSPGLSWVDPPVGARPLTLLEPTLAVRPRRGVLASRDDSKPIDKPFNFGVRTNIERCRYDTSRCGLAIACLVPDSTESATYVWIDGILKKGAALLLETHQRANKIPGMDVVCYKTTLFQALNFVRDRLPDRFSICPKTFILPDEYLLLQREHQGLCGQLKTPFWFVKPSNQCCGNGIRIIDNLLEMRTVQSGVAQLAVDPYLIDGRKFDFRIYLLIASLDPLTVFIYEEGIARFCTEQYSPPTRQTPACRFVHLSNTAVNIEGGGDPREFTLKASSVNRIMEPGLQAKIDEVCRALIVGIYPTIMQGLPRRGDLPAPVKARPPPLANPIFSKDDPSPGRARAARLGPIQPQKVLKAPLPLEKRYFHLLGADIIIDCDGNPMVLELDDRPSLGVTVQFEQDLKESMIAEVFEHVMPNGDVRASSPLSRWRRILPDPSWDDVVQRVIDPHFAHAGPSRRVFDGGRAKRGISDDDA
jgi:hypothetical protein